MVYIELKTEEEIRNLIKLHWNADNDAFLSPMFHGTDASMLSLLPQEREQIEAACDVVITALVKLFKDNSISITDKRLMGSYDERSNSGDALAKAQGRVNNSSLYNYDYFFVTNHPSRAIHYSKQSWICGESGWVANRLLETAQEIKMVLPNDDRFNRSLNVLNMRKQLQDDPMVMILVDVDSSGVCLENGVELKSDSDTDKLAVKISFVKSRNKICSIRLGKTALENVKNVYVVKKSNYNELMRAWEGL